MARRKRSSEGAASIIKADRIEEILNFGAPRDLNFVATAPDIDDSPAAKSVTAR
jgi:hypothetical protein